MGIGRNDVELLLRLREGNHIPVNPYVIEVGAQQLSDSFFRSEDVVRRASDLFGAIRPFAMPAAEPSGSEAESREHPAGHAPLARDFWRSLGFEYAAMDVDGSSGSIPLDLNYDRAPAELRGKFGLVTNFGTTEHVCNQMNAFEVIHDLAAPGAVMVHHLPAGGVLNRGLMTYNARFFWSLARSNAYACLHMDIYPGQTEHHVPEDMLAFIKSHAPASIELLRHCGTQDYAILVALQKKFDLPFVPPLDMDRGAHIRDPIVKRRYWTVFQPGILESLARGGDLPDWIIRNSPAAADSAAAYGLSDAPRTFAAYAAEMSDEIRTELGLKIGNASSEIRDDVARTVAASEEAVRAAVDRTVSATEASMRTVAARALAGSEEVRNELGAKLGIASDEIRSGFVRAIAASEEAIRDAIKLGASASEEGIRNAMANALSANEQQIRGDVMRAIAAGEEAIREAINRSAAAGEENIRAAAASALSASEEHIRDSVARAIAASEEAIREAIRRAVAESEDKLRHSIARTAGRRYVAFVGAAAALGTAAAVVAAIIVGARLLGL